MPLSKRLAHALLSVTFIVLETMLMLVVLRGGEYLADQQWGSGGPAAVLVDIVLLLILGTFGVRMILVYVNFARGG